MKRFSYFLARSVMQLICLLLGLILAAMLGMTASVQYYIMKSQQPQSDFLSVPAFSAQDTQHATGAADTGELVSILLIGQDAREGNTFARSDSMILCTYNPSAKKLYLTSFLRDLYVPIPGYEPNRINAAYAYGGSELLRQTLEENFGLQIDGSVEGDFTQFSKIVDLLGGVRIHLRQDEADAINEKTGSDLTEGTQLLDGDQALAYSRIRKLDADGDFSRTNRQRTVMEAIVDSYRNAGTGKILKLVYNLLPMIRTDMQTGQILALAVSVIPNLSQTQIVSQYVPAAGTYTDQMIDGMAVLVPDLEKCTEILRNSFLETAANTES